MTNITSKSTKSFPLFPSLLFFFVFFYLNDFLYIKLQNSFIPFMVIDYFTHLSPTFIILYLITKKNVTPSIFGIRAVNRSQVLSGGVILSIIGILIERGIAPGLAKFFSSTILFHYPKSPHTVYSLIDISIGVLFVATTEEFLFRGYLIEFLKSKGIRRPNIVFLSCFLFALMHWGSGVGSLITSFVWAMVPTLYYLKFGQIIPCIVAHFITDFVAFMIHYKIV